MRSKRQGPEFIDEGPVSPVVGEAHHTQRIRVGQQRWIGGLGLAAVTLIAVVLVGHGGNEETADLDNPVLPSTSTSEVASDPDDDAVTAPEHVEVLGDQQVFAVVSSRSENENRLITIAGPAIEEEPLPPFDGFEFDTSGQWLAATSISTLTEPRRVLWVAPVGGRFEPVAIDVRGFAWHDERPGRLAWTTSARDTLHLLPLAGSSPPVEGQGPQEIPLDIDGLLRGWGDWGFALQTSFGQRSSALVSPDGALVTSGVDGVFAGTWHDGRLLFSGGPGSSFISPLDGSVERVSWLDDDDYVWTMSTAFGSSVALVADRGLRAHPFTGAIVRSRGDRPIELAAEASAYSRVAWLDDAIIFADQEGLESQTLANARLSIVTDELERIEVPLPDLFDGRLWVTSIAVAS